MGLQGLTFDSTTFTGFLYAVPTSSSRHAPRVIVSRCRSQGRGGLDGHVENGKLVGEATAGERFGSAFMKRTLSVREQSLVA